MPFTPYSIHTILSGLPLEDLPSPPTVVPPIISQSKSFFTRRPSPSGPSGSQAIVGQGPVASASAGSRLTNFIGGVGTAKAVVEAVEAWGKSTFISLVAWACKWALARIFLPHDNERPRILSAENNLYIGTTDGNVLHYILEDQVSSDKVSLQWQPSPPLMYQCFIGNFNPVPQDAPYKFRFEAKHNLGFGRKVERILVIPQVSKAVVLCGTAIYITFMFYFYFTLSLIVSFYLDLMASAYRVILVYTYVDSTLSFYTLLPFFDAIPTTIVQHIKGVTCFCHDVAEEGRVADDGTIKLCVVKRRSIQIYKMAELVTMERSGSLVALRYTLIPQEIPLTDSASTIARHSTHLCLADNQMYKLIDTQQSQTIQLIPVPQNTIPTGSLSGSAPKPLVTVIGKGEFLVVSVSGNVNTSIGMFVSFTGDAIRGTLSWGSYPRSIGVEFPYVASLLRNNTIEIHNILDQQRLQTISFNPNFEPRGVSFGYGVRVWDAALAEKLKRRSNKSDQGAETEAEQRANAEVARFAAVATRLLVFGKESVMALLTTPLVLQVDTLLENGRLEEALALADQATSTMSPDNMHSDRMRHELDYLYQKSGLLYLRETVFDDAFQLLYRSKIEPRVVIRLFPDIARQAPDKHDEDEIILFDGVWSVAKDLGNIDIIGRFGELCFLRDVCGLWNICNQIEFDSFVIYFLLETQ
ncbi:hypothetical protein BC937DRAFT_94937 [Endogone sp. FLAS-F59071]|nr:hypothetical protein BC937DRAFT_94937 [Endogone sp. FLAS-F59071]|eukprot:RUS20562.1 hypothetical protein BC937DRAFT_94937 [Endogone sp. FLAS-F59071]